MIIVEVGIKLNNTLSYYDKLLKQHGAKKFLIVKPTIFIIPIKN